VSQLRTPVKAKAESVHAIQAWGGVHTGPLILTSAPQGSKQTASLPSQATLKVAPEQRTGWTPGQVWALLRISHCFSVIQTLA